MVRELSHFSFAGSKSRIRAPQSIGIALSVMLTAWLVPSRPGAAQWPPVIDLSTGHDTADVNVLGTTGLEQLGVSLASGDVNGDNATDQLILAGGASPLGRSYAGLLYVIWGPVPTGTISLADQTAPHSLIIPPTNSFGLYSSVECGDFNRDGFDDIILGIPCEYPSFNCKGKTLVIFGRESFPPTVDLESPLVDVTTILGSAADDGWLGYVSGHGDINGDTYEDIVLSAPSHSPGGHIYIVHGRSTFPPTIDLSSLQTGVTRLVESEPDWGAGQSLACADVNGDNVDDMLIGEPGESGPTASGKAILFYGSASLPTLITLTPSTPGTKHIAADPLQPGALGTGVALTDFDGDGSIDAVLSASGVGLTGCAECGVVYVLYSADELPATSSVTSPSVPITCIVGNINWRMGLTLSSGDVNDDGRADIAASAVQSGAIENLKVVVVYGVASRPNAIMATNPALTTIVKGESNDDNFGWSLLIDDINDDGTRDLSIGADYANVEPNFGAGKVYTLYGIDSPSGTTKAPIAAIAVRTYPNPMTGSLTIEYELPHLSDVAIGIYDVGGRQVLARVLRDVPAGGHTATWDGLDPLRGSALPLPSGIYFLRISALGGTTTRKITLLK